MTPDVLSIIVILEDLLIACFLVWRITVKKATLWGAARIIYGWIAILYVYHAGVYVATLFSITPDKIITTFIHPFVFLYMLNVLLVAIIHWRGGHIL